MRFAVPAVCGLLLFPCAARAQAPAWADLWRVAEGTLVRPAALADGPTGAFWNPAGVLTANGPAFAVDVYQAPDVVNVSSVLLGAAVGFARRAGVGVLAGRASVGDLVRTSTSPIVDGPEIPVYAQFAGAVAGGRVGPVEAGVTLLVHDARLDALGAGGVTLDVGVRVRPLRGLAIGAATHLGEPLATGGAASGYVGGVEYAFGIAPVIGLASRLQLRYGFATRERAGADHVGSIGLLLTERLLIDAGAHWSGGYGVGSWQPVVGVAFQARPFRVGIARGSGASDLGATYRITLGVNGAP